MSETFSRPSTPKGTNLPPRIDSNRLLRIVDICSYMGICRTTASKVAREAGCMVSHGKVYVFESALLDYLISQEVPHVS